MFNLNAPQKRQLKHLKEIKEQLEVHLPKNLEEKKLLKQTDTTAFGQSVYLEKQNNIAVYKNTKVTYFSSGESFFKKYIEEINQKKRDYEESGIDKYITKKGD